MKDDGALTMLGGHFALLSLFAVGGANAAIPEMHRIAVDSLHWMSDRQFTDMFALSQVSPGPNVIIVTLIGYHVAGIAGALVATLAMCGPTCLFAFAVTRAWDRFKDAPWRVAIQSGLVPVSLGLMAASVFVVAAAGEHSVAIVALTVIAAAVSYATRLNPLWLFAGSAALGLAGLL